MKGHQALPPAREGTIASRAHANDNALAITCRLNSHDRRRSQHSLLRVSHVVDCVQLPWMDLAANPSLAPCGRVAHRAVLVWLGPPVQMGYCPFTDWHWEVRARLGHHDPPSYIQLLIRELIGIDLGPTGADALAVITLAAVALLSVLLHGRDRRALRARLRT